MLSGPFLRLAWKLKLPPPRGFGCGTLDKSTGLAEACNPYLWSLTASQVQGGDEGVNCIVMRWVW